jgi:ligand-binding sensor domain-containing protein
MKIKLLFAIFLLLCLAPPIHAKSLDPSDHLQTVHSQISNLNISAFCQDSLGNMWIATKRGLNRYNGYEFVQYFHDKNDSLSIGDDLIISLFLDSSHRLWIGTATGINQYDFAANTFRKYPYFAYSFYEDHARKLWVGTSVGPGWIDAVHHKVIMDSDETSAVNLFMEDDTKKLWMGLKDNMGLAYKNENSWEYLTIPGKRSVTCMFRDPQGIWWLGTNAGLALFDPITQTFKDPPETCSQNALLNHTHINFIKEISPLRLCIGTESQGLFQYDILTQTLLHNEPQQLGVLGSDQLISCYIDRQENVWIGSFDRGFSVWKRYLDYFNPDPVLNNATKDKFITRILEDVYGNLWIGTRYHGLFHYTPSGKLTQYHAGNSNLFKDNNYLIESLFIDSQNRIWIGLNEELLMGDFTRDGHLTIRQRKEMKRVTCMAEEKNGRLWAGTSSGLYRLTADNRRIET